MRQSERLANIYSNASILYFVYQSLQKSAHLELKTESEQEQKCHQIIECLIFSQHRKLNFYHLMFHDIFDLSEKICFKRIIFRILRDFYELFSIFLVKLMT
jgi:hypothetical protein